MNKLCIFLITTILYSRSFAALPPLEASKEELSRPLELIIAQAEELDSVLTLDQHYYDNSIRERVGGIEFQNQLMTESVAHIYLIPSVRALLVHIKELAQQEKTDPEMKNLTSALTALPPLELKYLRSTYEWEKKREETSTVPIHTKARSKPLNRQQCLIQCSITDYRASMGQLLNTYKERRKEAQEKDQKELAMLHR